MSRPGRSGAVRFGAFAWAGRSSSAAPDRTAPRPRRAPGRRRDRPGRLLRHRPGPRRRALGRAACLPLFWQFVGFGDDRFAFLRKLDELAVPRRRIVDNAGFLAAGPRPPVLDGRGAVQRAAGRVPVLAGGGGGAGAARRGSRYGESAVRGASVTGRRFVS
ncbi:VWA domain-containing protein [Streptomyces albidoflavus]|uniref:VWA domain-containing protein n=1 Tax=Streptomyces albidoflavus TaxID=1886 RepID=UPI001F5C84AF|nr:VWA domain-containing protein [Streptomyces albidoflavus]